MITPNFGILPETRDELIKRLFEAWKIFIQNPDAKIEEFQATNVHSFFQIFCEHKEELIRLILDLDTRKFDFFLLNNMIINGSFGASLEGWVNQFVINRLCKGIDIVSADDERARSKWTSDEEKLRPGEIVIYFDELEDEPEEKVEYGSEIHTAFLKCKNIAEPTRHGTKTIKIYFSNGRVAEYNYNNIKESDYVGLDVRVTLDYETGGMQYPENKIKEIIQTSFDERNNLGHPFFVNTLLCINDFDNLKDITVEVKKTSESEANYKNKDMKAELGVKYKLENIKVIQKATKTV